MHDIAALINDYRRHAASHASTEYGDQASVRAGNDAADAMRVIAREVAAAGQSAVRQFAVLLEESAAGGWAAHHLVELMDAEPALLQRALAVIEARSRGDTASALGERVWLKAWRAKVAGAGHGAPEA